MPDKNHILYFIDALYVLKQLKNTTICVLTTSKAVFQKSGPVDPLASYPHNEVSTSRLTGHFKQTLTKHKQDKQGKG